MRLRVKLSFAWFVFAGLLLGFCYIGISTSQSLARKSLTMDRIHEFLGIHEQLSRSIYKALGDSKFIDLEELDNDILEYKELFDFAFNHFKNLERINEVATKEFYDQTERLTEIARGLIANQLRLKDVRGQLEPLQKKIILASHELDRSRDDNITLFIESLLDFLWAERRGRGSFQKVKQLIQKMENGPLEASSFLSEIAQGIPQLELLTLEIETLNEEKRVLEQEFQELSEAVALYADEFPSLFRWDIAALSSETILSGAFFISIMCGAGVFVFLFAYFGMRMVTGPLSKIERGIREIDQGNLEVQIPENSKDEFGVVAHAFNNMALSLHQSTEALKKAKEEAELAHQAKASFLSCMSHELRTPLNAILGYAELLDEEMMDLQLDEYRKDLEKIRVSGIHLLRLINDILDLHKMEADKLEISPEPVHTREMVEMVVGEVAPLFGKNQNQFKLDLPRDLPSMTTDVVRIRQVLINLLGNAAKFTHEGEICLSVRVLEASKDISFAVSDTGIGMTEEQQRKVFEEFVQADSSTTRKYGGSGLGLNISLKLAKLMKGTLEVESKYGEGTTFIFTVPIHLSQSSGERLSSALN